MIGDIEEKYPLKRHFMWGAVFVMRQNSNSGDLDMILERDRKAGRSSAGRASAAGNVGRSRSGGREAYRYGEGGRRSAAAGRNVTGRSGMEAGYGRNAQDVQLWKDDRGKSAPAARYGSREAQMRYRRELRRKKRQRQMLLVRSLVGAAALLLLLAAGFGMWKIGSHLWKKEELADEEAMLQIEQEQQYIDDNKSEKPAMEENFLTPNEYSRPQEPLPEVTEIFVHYTANKGTSAAQNRSYFENLGITGETSASAHFVIGFNGEIIQCLPLDEIGYAVMEHNYNSISIECCYLREDGKFEDATYDSLIRLVGWLMSEYDLGPSAVKRHYDSNGKLCPKYYVEHEDEWEQFIRDVENYINGSQTTL